jgi:hypothetical protein
MSQSTPILRPFVVAFSGGAMSWAAAHRTIATHGQDAVTLLFADTATEEDDLYRFVREGAEALGAPLVWLRDGRDVWDVMKDRRMIGNSRIDVARVERAVDEQFTDPIGMRCGQCDRGQMFLQAGRKGGAYLRCNHCGATASPPQEVRDLIRGTPSHLTIAGAAEPVLEPGERTVESDPLDPQTRAIYEETTRMLEPHLPADANDSAVQSESERDTIGDDQVGAEPASAESAPIPEPDDPKERSQAMRNAIYQHWILPRPTANKIELRGLLEEFGWTSGDTLADWLLPLPEDKIAAIAEAVAGVS